MFRCKAYKYRLYPNEKQKAHIHKTIGSARFVYNHFLNEWTTAYKETGKGLSYTKCSAALTQLKKQSNTLWLKEPDSIALQAALEHLSDAFDGFFQKKKGYPAFKRKTHGRQSYTTKWTNDNIVVLGNKIKLPKLGWVRFAKSKDVKGTIQRAIISKTPTGKYFVSVVCQVEMIAETKSGAAIGIDLGITDFAVLSTGVKEDNHRFTSKMEATLKREQRKLSRRYDQAKKDGKELTAAKNYQKQRLKVAGLYEKVANQRQDFLNKLSTTLIKNHDVICIEALDIQGMKKNRKLAKQISDVSWSAFVDKLTYKAEWHNRSLIKVSQWFPSSQLCSACGHIDGKKPLIIREWLCPACGVHHDRDINASINILNEGLKTLIQPV